MKKKESRFETKIRKDNEKQEALYRKRDILRERHSKMADALAKLEQRIRDIQYIIDYGRP